MWLTEEYSYSKTACIISKIIAYIIRVGMHVKHLDSACYLSGGWCKYISKYGTIGTSPNENGAAYEDDRLPSGNAG